MADMAQQEAQADRGRRRRRMSRVTTCWPTRRWWSRPRPVPASASQWPSAALEEGARVLISDIHERRVGEAVEALAVSGRDSRAIGSVQRDRRGRRAGAVRGGGRPARPHRRPDQQRRPGRRGAAGRDDRRAVVGWCSMSRSTAPCAVPEPAMRHMNRPWSRGHRQQCLGGRVAGPGRPVPLRGGQGRGDGPHTLCRASKRPSTGSASTPWPPAWPCIRSWPRSRARSFWPSWHSARRSGGRPRCGRWPTSWCSWPVIYSSYLTGEVLSVSSQHP